MSGYFCIAMLEDPPYKIIFGTTEKEPEDWQGELTLPSHLLCYEKFKNAKSIAKKLIKILNEKGILAKEEKYFSALPHDVINQFIIIRNEALKNNYVIIDTLASDSSYEEGKRLYDLAIKFRDGDINTIPDPKKSFKYFKESANLGYEPAYLNIAFSYLDGDGVKRDLNEALDWAYKMIETGDAGYGVAIATKCFTEVDMTAEAEQLWLHFFENVLTDININDTQKSFVLSDYVGQVMHKKISPVHTATDSTVFPRFAKILRTEDAGFFEKEINWLENKC